MPFSDLFKRKPSAQQLQIEKAEAELAFLKSQLNPHLLYTALDHIYAMAYPVSDEMAEAVTKLSALMRYLLNDNINTPVDLEKEIGYLHQYINLYRLRFNAEFFVDLKISGDSAPIQIVPLLLLHFVEDAFKCGITNDDKRPVRINLQAAPNRLTFTVSYKIDHTKAGSSNAMDIGIIRRRLELQYPDRFELMIANNGETCKTTLTIRLVSKSA